MMRIHKAVCSVGGIGYITKGSGTVASIVAALAWWIAFRYGASQQILVFASVAIVVIGIWSAGKVESLWGKDSSRVVVDEVAGMSISLILVPVASVYFVSALVLFRFFDILKPLWIRKLEDLPKGWGVMADDVAAGIYAAIILQVIVALKIF